jgi:streptogramin lyase
MAVSVILTALAAVASACSTSGNANGMLPNGGGGRDPMLRPAIKPVRIKEFADLPVYSTNYYPAAIAKAAGDLWVADDIDQDAGACAIVQIAPTGKALNTFYAYGPTSEGSYFQDITLGPDGALWLADSYNRQVVRMTTNGRFTDLPLPHFSGPLSITTGPDEALWLTTSGPSGAGIFRLTTKGQMTFYALGTAGLDIAAGSDGALWFTQPSADEIGRITTHGKITEYTNGITAGSQPFSIAPGPDGALWFTERKGGRIGRMTTTGDVTEYSRGITYGEEPVDLAAGPDGAMWFTEYEGYSSYGVIASKIGRITMNGKVTEYANGLNPLAGPAAIAEGPGRTVWFVETNADKTGRLRL